MISISLIIVNWNTRRLLADCLRSIYQAAAELPIEVIVVDNGSQDGSPEMVAEEFPQVALISNLENRGFARANNQGMQIAQGKYLLLLNTDTLIKDGALRTLCDYMEADCRAGALGPQLLNADGSLQPSGRSYPTLISALGEVLPAPQSWRRKLRGPLERRDYGQVCEVDEISGAAMCLRRKALDQVGLLDEAFFFLGEDVDLCWRLKKAGWRIIYLPQAQVVHYWGGSSPKSENSRHSLLAQRAYLLLFRKHHNHCQASLLKAVLFAVTGFKLAKWLLRAALCGEQVEVQKTRQLFRDELVWIWRH